MSRSLITSLILSFSSFISFFISGGITTVGVTTKPTFWACAVITFVIANGVILGFFKIFSLSFLFFSSTFKFTAPICLWATTGFKSIEILAFGNKVWAIWIITSSGRLSNITVTVFFK